MTLESDATSPPVPLLLPPRLYNPDGVMRQVGVELEFAALTAHQAAALVQATFGGRIERLDPHRYRVRDTALGDFETELDSQYAHADPDAPPPPEWAELEGKIREWIGDLSAYWVPCEVVGPPVPLSRLAELDRLLLPLTQAGAEGTRESPMYAFALQFNPEVASTSADYILSVLRAYVILSDWLRAEIDLHITRYVLPFANPFPADYALLICDPVYTPDRAALIDDYLAYNATRNRELDMLPLFAWLDPQRVRDATEDRRINARPTFHYRLPDARVGERGWTIAQEWNRWVQVERLAEDPSRLAGAMRAFLEHRERWLPGSWAQEARRWLAD